MKRKNQSNRTVAFAAISLLILLIGSCQLTSPAQEPEGGGGEPERIVMFEGSLEKLGRNPDFVSGVMAVYRLAKYRVERVCKGTYDKSEIVVDHLVFNREEFDGFKVGNTVCVTAKISNKVHTRYNGEEIRDPSETITTFYVASNKITRADESKGCCDIAR